MFATVATIYHYIYQGLCWLQLPFWCLLMLVMISRKLRNRRLPAQIREMARRLGAPRPSWWACVHKPRLKGTFGGVELFIDFLERATGVEEWDEADGTIWIDLHLQAPPDISGRIRHEDRTAVFEELRRECTDAEQLELERASFELTRSTDLCYTLGWARIGFESCWDAADLTPDLLTRLISATITILRLIAIVERRRALEAAGTPTKAVAA